MKFADQILYVDFDGVFHSDGVWVDKDGKITCDQGELFEYCQVLETALERYPDVKIVLSTTWVPVCSYSRARKRLTKGLQDRCIGATWHSDIKRNPDSKAIWDSLTRYGTIYKDVYRRQPKQFLAIDDDDFGWPEDEEHWLVKTDALVGLGDVTTIRNLLKKLEETFGNPGRTSLLPAISPVQLYDLADMIRHRQRKQAND